MSSGAGEVVGPGRVVVVGSANLDRVLLVPTLPSPGETIRATGTLELPGGKGLNQAVTVARQGVTVDMVAALGDDAAGTLLASTLAAAGVGTGRVLRVPGPSGSAVVTVAGSGENTVVVLPGANAGLDADAIAGAAALFRRADVVLAQLEVPLDAVGLALRLGREAGARTILNPAPAPAPAPGPATSLLPELLGLADVVVPNETEATALTGLAEPGAAARALLGAGAGRVVVTLGDAGALVAEMSGEGSAGGSSGHRAGGIREWRMAAYPVDAVDTTAAGDAFCGALAAGLASGLTFSDALRRATAAGALASTVRGALPSLPTATAVDAFLEARVGDAGS